jgi:hypothetical protein
LLAIARMTANHQDGGAAARACSIWAAWLPPGGRGADREARRREGHGRTLLATLVLAGLRID